MTAPRPNRILVMTATVAPPAGAPGLVRIDPQLRMADYSTALSWYAGLLGRDLDQIIFAENSNYDLAPLKEAAARAGQAKRIEFLGFDGIGTPPNYGRCHGESVILDRAMRDAAFAREADPSTHFWKVTGRYRVLNLALLARTRPKTAAFYCDLRNHNSPWADMRVMSWTREGFDAMLRGVGESIREDANGGRPGEETLHGVLSGRLGRVESVTSFCREPLIDGVRAFDNQNWGQGRQRLVFVARDVQRRILNRVFF